MGVRVVGGDFCITTTIHLFSAIPEIDYDDQAGGIITAVTMGKELFLAFASFSR